MILEKRYLIAFHKWKRYRIEEACAAIGRPGMGEEYWTEEDSKDIENEDDAVAVRIWLMLKDSVFLVRMECVVAPNLFV